MRGSKNYIVRYSQVHTIFKFYKINNKLMWFELKSKLIKDNNDLPTGFIGTIIDVTNLKETEV